MIRKFYDIELGELLSHLEKRDTFEYLNDMKDENEVVMGRRTEAEYLKKMGIGNTLSLFYWIHTSYNLLLET